MTFLLAIALYSYFVACLAAVWLGWQSGVALRFRDEWEARQRREIWRRINAAALASMQARNTAP